MNNNELDDLLRAGLLRRAQQVADAHRDQPVPEPSPAHRRWKRKFLAAPFAWAERAKRPVWRRAACVAAAVLLAVSLSLAVSPTVRAWVQKIVVQNHEGYDSFTFGFDKAESAETTGTWYPNWIPEGYILEVDSNLLGVFGTLIYENEVDETICICYMHPDGNAFNVDNEHHIVTKVSINGEDGYFLQGITREYLNCLIWMDTSSNLAFYLDGYLSKTELIRIAESISQK